MNPDMRSSYDPPGDLSQDKKSGLTKSIFLIGFMGAGKSTLARRLARVIGAASVDMDVYIERKTGMSIASIFDMYGESGFREIETDVLRELASRDEPMIVSCGGGLVISDANWEILSSSGFVIHLEVDADEASKRISDKSSRPLFSDMESARKRAMERLPLYREVSDVDIPTFGKNVKDISREVSRILQKEGILCQQQG